MKKLLIILLSVSLLNYCNNNKTSEEYELESIEEVNEFDYLSLPNKTSTFSKDAALKVMNLCSKYSISSDKSSFTASTINVIGQYNYNKADTDANTCAYTIGVKSLEVNDNYKNMYVVSIRGTNSKEWLSNFNVAPTYLDESEYAENFYECAVDVLDSLMLHVNENEKPLFLVTGHSRGAATANILAKLLNDKYGKRNVYAYTFATPNTALKIENSSKYENIFNIINPEDLVCRMPFENWGFHRFGQDIILDITNKQNVDNINNAISTLSLLVPTINDYYNTKHSLIVSGTSNDGKTPYEVSLMLAEAIVSGNYQTLLSISPLSDYAPMYSFYSMAFSNSAHNLSTYKDLLNNYNA